MKRNIAGWKKAVVYDPATGNLVQFNTLSLDGCSWDPQNIKNETPTGSAFGGRNRPLAIGFLDTDGLTQIKSWGGKTLLNAVVLVPGGQHILFRENEPFFYTPGGGVNTRDGAVQHVVDAEAHGEDPAVHQKKNLAELITFTNDAGSLVFPLEGPTLTLAAGYASINSPELSIIAKDYGTDGTDGSTLATSTQAVGSTGRESTTITLPANTYLIEIDLVGAGSADVTNVSLRTDGKTTYITY